MYRLTVASIAAAALVAVVAPATAAHADEAGTDLVAQCITDNPGAVTDDAVTDGDDLVCVGDDQAINGSRGDDTYLWVTTNPATATIGVRRALDSQGHPVPGFTDLGHDTLSLALWPGAYTDTSMWGYRAFGVDATESLVLTGFNDTFNLPHEGDCGLTENTDASIDAGDGDDTVNCVAGNITTGTGADTVNGASIDSVVDTGTGADTVENISVHTTVDTGADADTVTGVGGDSEITTADGNDTITDVAASTVTAGAGDDVIDNVSDASTIFAGTGNDTIMNADASTIYAQAGDDTVAGVSGSDHFVLGAGADRAFVVGKGIDTVLGGKGADRVHASRNDHVHSARKVR